MPGRCGKRKKAGSTGFWNTFGVAPGSWFSSKGIRRMTATFPV